MDRMKLWLLPIYAVVGFIALLLALPDSRWVVCTQWDVLAGHWRGEVLRSDSAGFRHGSVEPVFPELDKEKPSPDETSKFLTLADFPPESTDPKVIVANLSQLFEVCKTKNDIRYWATFVAIGSTITTLPRIGESTRLVIGSIPEVQSMLKYGCDEGKKLDPDNAFFPANQAAAIYFTTDPKKPDPGIVQAARSEYIAASKRSKYDDFANFKPETTYLYLLGHTLPKGNLLKSIAYFRYGVSPSGLFSLPRTFIKADDVEGQVATLKLFSAIVRGSQAEFTAIFAASKIADTFRTGTKYDHPMKSVLSKADVDTLVRSLQAKAGPDPAIAEAGKIDLAVNERMAKWGDSRVDLSTLINSDRPALSSIAGLALLLVPFAFLFAWASFRFERLRVASPHLIWLIGFTADRSISNGNEVPLYFAFAGLLFIPALVPSLQKHVDQVAWLITGIAYVAWISLGTYLPFLMIFLPFSAALYIQRRLENPNPLLTIAGAVLACLTGATYWIVLTASRGVPMALTIGMLGFIGACGMIRVGNPVPWYKVVGTSCLILGVFYAAVVARDISADRQLAIVNQTLGQHPNGLLGSP